MNTHQLKIRSFQDLEVYQNSYRDMPIIHKEIIPKLPNEEKYDLISQLSRSSKSVPRLIAEGHSKRHQKKGFQKYIDDAMAESNETIVSLSQAKDLYPDCLDHKIVDQLIDSYDKTSRQLYNLALAWSKFDPRRKIPTPKPSDVSSRETV